MPPTDAVTPAAMRVGATVFALDGTPRPGERVLAAEVAVNLVYGTVPYAVMMATPADLEDFAVGFSLTEGVIAARAEIRGVRTEAAADGLRLLIDLVPERFHTLLARRRAMSGRTGCGVCGIEDLASVPRAGRPGGVAPDIRLRALQRALAGFGEHQALNAATRAVHGAAWAGLDGGIRCVREDVGRHNALDKLIGALLTQGVDPVSGMVLVTSRCSFEMVEKTAAFGARTLVAISAPTALGVERAAHHGMTLIGVARADAVTAFTGAGHIVVEEAALA